MPSTSKKQAKFMTANCKSPEFRKKTGMKKKVACDFHDADKGKYHEGMKEMASNEKSREKTTVNKERKRAKLNKYFGPKKKQGGEKKVGHYVAGGQSPTRKTEEKIMTRRLQEKTKLNHALTDENGDEKEFRSSDISRMKKLAGINQRIDAAKDEGKMPDLTGVIQSVANGSMPVESKDYSFIKSLNEEIITEGCGNPDRIMGPYGEQITVRDLPPSNTKRWVMRRKALVVAAVRGGLISLEEACRRYALSVEEFLSWQQAIDRHGLPGLRTTRTQLYRDSDQEHEQRQDGFGATNESVEDLEEDGDHEHDYDPSYASPEAPGDYDPVHGTSFDQKECPECGANNPDYWTGAHCHGCGYDTEGDYDDGQPSSYDEYQDYMGGDDWDHGQYDESTMFPKESLSRSMIEMIVDEMNKGKETKEISEELSFDPDHVAKVVEFVKSKNTPIVEKDDEDLDESEEELDEAKDWTPPWEKDDDKEEVDETKEEVDEATEEVDEDTTMWDDDDDMGPASYLSQQACNDAGGLFLDAVTGKLGGAIGEQARSICRDGEPLEEQNGNALRYIAEYAKYHGIDTVAVEIEEYLQKMMGSGPAEPGMASDEHPVDPGRDELPYGESNELDRMKQLSGI